MILWKCDPQAPLLVTFKEIKVGQLDLIENFNDIPSGLGQVLLELFLDLLDVTLVTRVWHVKIVSFIQPFSATLKEFSFWYKAILLLF